MWRTCQHQLEGTGAKRVQISWGPWSVPQNRKKPHCQEQPEEKEVAHKMALVHDPAGLNFGLLLFPCVFVFPLRVERSWSSCLS